MFLSEERRGAERGVQAKMATEMECARAAMATPSRATVGSNSQIPSSSKSRDGIVRGTTQRPDRPRRGIRTSFDAADERAP